MIATRNATPSTTERPSWQCRFAGRVCTNPRVTLISGQVHELCEEHRLCKTPSTRRFESLDEEPAETPEEDDWEYQPMNGADWKLTSHDLMGDDSITERGAALADGVVFGPIFFHTDIEALHACSPTKCR